MSTTAPFPVSGPALARAPPVLTHRQVMVVLSGLLIGMFLAALDQTVVSTAMRTTADELDGQTAQAWVTTACLTTSTISTPLYGELSDQYGREPFYLAATSRSTAGAGPSSSTCRSASWRSPSSARCSRCRAARALPAPTSWAPNC